MTRPEGSEPDALEPDVQDADVQDADMQGHDMQGHDEPRTTASRDAPGGPYFGRLLIVLLLAVAFCAFMTWLLSTTLPD